MTRHQRADTLQIARKRQRRKVVGGKVFHALHLHIPPAVECEFRCQHSGHAVGNIDILCLGAAQVVAIKVSILQGFAPLQAHGLAHGDVDTHRECTRHILSQVQHYFPRRGVQHGGCQFGKWAYRHAVPGGQLALGRVGQRGGHGGEFRQRRVKMLTVVDAAEGDVAAANPPAFVGADYFFCAVGMGDMHLRNQQPVRTIIRFLAALKAETALVPSVAQGHAQVTAFLQLGSDVIGLILQPRIVIVAVGR